MCGIAGIISSSTVEELLIKKMNDIISYRGPNNEGVIKVCDGRVALGHRRLSIIDLSAAGKQPMFFLNQRYCITYNGEIYNYLELRGDLEKKGYKFHSDSDTEVVMAAYHEWGSSCLEKFNGMWAFILVDTVQEKVLISRDRFGVKPLYFWHSPSGFWAFASEIKQFSVLDGWSAKVNGQRAYDFLNWSILDHTQETMFKNVYQLRGGEMIEAPIKIFLENELPVHKWYELKPKCFKGNLDEAVESFYNIFVDSIKLRLRSDVLIGSCLSGGLDSSAIVCTMNEILKKENKQFIQRTVSAYTKVKKYDESEYVREVLNKINVRGHYINLDENQLFETIDKLIWHQDEPFASTSIFAQWKVFEEASKNGLGVMLDGQGADEQLAGYHSFFGKNFASMFKNMHWINLYREILACKKIHDYNFMFAIKGIIDSMISESVCNKIRMFSGKTNTYPDWINMKNMCIRADNPYIEMNSKTTSIKEFSIQQITANNLPMMLHWADRNSMAHSVESRLPFLDYRLVEFVLGLPDIMKLSGGITKKILRNSMGNIVPSKVNMRMDKMGFVTPEEIWLKNNKKIIMDFTEKTVKERPDIFFENTILLVDRILSGEKPFNFIPWRIFCFGKWLNIYGVK